MYGLNMFRSISPSEAFPLKTACKVKSPTVHGYFAIQTDTWTQQ